VHQTEYYSVEQIEENVSHWIKRDVHAGLRLGGTEERDGWKTNRRLI
jgi:hypothetical protein